MALDTFTSIWRQVLLRCPVAGPFLARDFVNNTFRNIAERRRWSWLVSRNQFLTNAALTAGTVAVVRGSTTVTGTGTGWTGVEVGRQFRPSINIPIYDIASVDTGAQTLTLNSAYGGATQSGLGYQIYNVYLTVPVDFHAFVSVWDPKMNWQINTLVTQQEINAYDAQRANQGNPYVVAPYDYDPLMTGYAAGTPPLPRYEIWPNQTQDYCLPFLYETRATDLTEANATLPRYIRGDVLLEGALEQAALWPGPSRDTPNPYFSMQLAQFHAVRKEKMIQQLEVQDDEVYLESVWYDTSTALPFAPLPWVDAHWLQTHAY